MIYIYISEVKRSSSSILVMGVGYRTVIEVDVGDGYRISNEKRVRCIGYRNIADIDEYRISNDILSVM